VSAVKKPNKSFFVGLFDKKNFISTKKFNGEKKGYVFKTDNQGLGYYKNKDLMFHPRGARTSTHS